MFQPLQLVYIHRPPLAASTTSNTKKFATISCKKVILKTMGPFLIASVEPSTLSIDKHSIHNPVSINRATLASGHDSQLRTQKPLPVEDEPQTTRATAGSVHYICRRNTTWIDCRTRRIGKQPLLPNLMVRGLVQV